MQWPKPTVLFEWNVDVRTIFIDPVSIILETISSNEKLHFIQGCCLLVVSCCLIAISAEPQHQPDHKYLQKVPILNKYKKAKKNTKKWKWFSVPLADLSWTMLVTWRLLVSCFEAFNVFKSVTEIWCIATKLLS